MRGPPRLAAAVFALSHTWCIPKNANSEKFNIPVTLGCRDGTRQDATTRVPLPKLPGKLGFSAQLGGPRSDAAMTIRLTGSPDTVTPPIWAASDLAQADTVVDAALGCWRGR